MNKITCVYIAGKLNDDAVGYIQNMHRMMVTAEKVRCAGFAVLIPCLDILMGLKFGDYDYSDYFDNNVQWLKRSDAVFLTPGWEDSSGTQKEITIAKSMGIPVFSDISEMLKQACIAEAESLPATP